ALCSLLPFSSGQGERLAGPAHLATSWLTVTWLPRNARSSATDLGSDDPVHMVLRVHLAQERRAVLGWAAVIVIFQIGRAQEGDEVARGQRLERIQVKVADPQGAHHAHLLHRHAVIPDVLVRVVRFLVRGEWVIDVEEVDGPLPMILPEE